MVELGCALLRLPPINLLAWHVFFGRGSFPDMEQHPAARGLNLMTLGESKLT